MLSKQDVADSNVIWFNSPVNKQIYKGKMLRLKESDK